MSACLLSMSEYNRNPLHKLGEFSWVDYKIFKAHLRLPRPYLRIIFKNYTSMHEAVFALPNIIEGYATHLWEKQIMNAVEFKEKLYQSCHIPPQYHKVAMYITSTPKDQSDVAALVKSAGKMQDKGLTLYFHSEFMEGAMHAACDILRSAIDKKLRGFCISYPNVLDIIKQWDPDNPVVQRITSVDILVLWGVGTEYTTEFTNAQLNSILIGRRANCRTTVVVSSLNPKDFKSRYGAAPEGVCVGFTDPKLTQTLSEVRAMLEGNA